MAGSRGIDLHRAAVCSVCVLSWLHEVENLKCSREEMFCSFVRTGPTRLFACVLLESDDARRSII
jgi:hypothetical protein